MEKIYIHIQKLLSRNEYVVVPGLGGFVLQHQSAVIVDNTVYSPHKTISFNPLMHHADGLLVIEIARTEQVSYRKAQELLHVEIDKLKRNLQLNRSCSFGDFGVLSLTDEDSICFSPNRFASFIPMNIGNVDYKLHEVSMNNELTNASTAKTIQLRSFMHYAAMFVLVMSLLFLSEKLNRNQTSQTASIINLKALTYAVASIDTVVVKCPELVETKLQDNIVHNNDSNLYHVIVASMPTIESAEAYKNMLVDETYQCAHVLAPVKTVRVAIQSFTNKQEAIAYMEQLRMTDKRFETAWVLCKR
ncbi:MAG: hypothetical protein ACOYM7_04330 [Paludibacter sp.]